MLSYRLLKEAMGPVSLQPTQLLSFSINSTVSGFIAHDDYVSFASAVEDRPPPARQLLDRIQTLVSFDTNPLSVLLRSSGSDIRFIQRWNRLNQHLKLGVSTQIEGRSEQRLRRHLHKDADSPLRRNVMEMFVDQLGVEAARPDPFIAREVGLESVAQALGLTGTAIAGLIEVLHDDPAADIPVCAKAMGCSTRTLQRQLSGLGLSFLMVRQAVRVRIATRMLRYTTVPLTEIGLAAGFYDASHFNRAIKLSTCISPTEYRALWS